MSLMEVLRQSRSLQIEADAKIERALSQSASQSSPTELRLRRTSSDMSSTVSSSSSRRLPGGEWTTTAHYALSSAAEAVATVARVAATHVAVAPFVIPADCLTLTPSAAFLVLYHYALECTMQATRVAFDSQLNSIDAPLAAVHCAHHLLQITEKCCSSLARVVSSVVSPAPLSTTPSKSNAHQNYVSRSPQILRAWLLIGFEGKYQEAVDLLEPTFGSLLDEDDAVVDLSTLGDALCLAAMGSMLLGLPERALPLLIRAQRLSQRLQDSSEGWLCSRGRRTQVFALLLRGEARRALHQLQRNDHPDWIDDVRLAAKLSQDGSRPFSGIPIDATVQALRYPSTTGGQQTESPAWMMLPRLLHRMVHTFCGSLCVSIISELTSNSEVLLGCEGEGKEVRTESAMQMYWYDVASLFSVKTTFPCISHLPDLCPEHECSWPSNAEAGSSTKCNVGAYCYQLCVEAEPAPATERFQKVFYELLLSRKMAETSSSQPPPKQKPLFGNRTQSNAAASTQHTTSGVWGTEDGEANSGGELLRPNSSSSLRNRLFRTGGTREQSVRTPTTMFAFNSSFPVKESKAEPSQQQRAASFSASNAAKHTDNAFAASAAAVPSSSSVRRHTIASTINVFDRLTTPNSARGHRGSFTFESTDRPEAITRPMSARPTKSSVPASNSQEKESVGARPSSAKLQRSVSAVGGSQSARRSESRLAHSMRDKVSSAR
ncbi:Hypothetical protein, putative [Bodo saltans]|uniref:Uncharacterized protein n=1 Tax=Bodo saltans TaxID=75058 RepID=A0A0S4JRN8_BODSA|nr:Hypothetical protein, putative [Bodo saltans]|eukprot:CUG92868.1 Hypothetical protein, putative [Bodo saltans]